MNTSLPFEPEEIYTLLYRILGISASQDRGMILVTGTPFSSSLLDILPMEDQLKFDTLTSQLAVIGTAVFSRWYAHLGRMDRSVIQQLSTTHQKP